MPHSKAFSKCPVPSSLTSRQSLMCVHVCVYWPLFSFLFLWELKPWEEELEACDNWSITIGWKTENWSNFSLNFKNLYHLFFWEVCDPLRLSGTSWKIWISTVSGLPEGLQRCPYGVLRANKYAIGGKGGWICLFLGLIYQEHILPSTHVKVLPGLAYLPHSL